MSVKVSKLENSQVCLTFKVDQETFEETVNRVFVKTAKKIAIPGFRKGKAPRKVIEKYYGEGIFYDDAIDEICPAEYEKAVTDKKLEPVDRPQLEIVEIGKGKDFVFKATVTVKPDVTLGDYKGVSVEKADYPVTDEDVDREVSAAREKNGSLETVENRPVKEGDTVVMDFEGFVNGTAFEGGKGENYSLEIGSGQFIPGFEEQLVGAETEKEVEVKVTFPEDYHAEELKGKDAVFKCTVHEIKEKVLPELDDEFAKDVSEFDTLDEYKKDIREKLEKNAEERAKRETENKVVEAVVSNATVEVPACMVDQRIDSRIQEMGYQMQSQGLSMEQYLQFTGMTMDALRDQLREEAEKNVRTSLVLEKVAKSEKIKALKKDLEAEYKKMAEQYGMEAAKVKELMAPQEDVLKSDLAIQKAVEFLVENAEIK